ncbi:MAG: alcohol dehydrogenase catalytic domain-containing protein [Elusimicrobia bacterium]|nr:alcohol dehydrogenase catalytic domain-containing protein [Elusimicrobiota bacterium]
MARNGSAIFTEGFASAKKTYFLSLKIYSIPKKFMETMTALVKSHDGEGADIKKIAVPRPRSGEVLLKVHRSSICGSDLPIYYWSSWAPRRIKPPLVFGHEICGEVVEKGAGVTIAVGSRVAVESHIYCGYCATCAAGDRHLCRRMVLVGIDTDGGFADYVTIPERVLWKLDSRIPYDYASLMEPLGNAIYTVCVEPVQEKTVLVMGCGPQGLYAVQAAKAAGAALIVAVEKSAFRAKLAKGLGAHHVIGDHNETFQDIQDKLLSFNQTQEGFDVCLEMSGASALISTAFRVLRNGGRLSLFGLTAGKTGIDIGEDIIFKGIHIYGILGRRLFETWEMMEKYLLEDKISLPKVVTHEFPLTQAQEAFALFSAPEKACGKIVFKVNS